MAETVISDGAKGLSHDKKLIYCAIITKGKHDAEKVSINHLVNIALFFHFSRCIRRYGARVIFF